MQSRVGSWSLSTDVSHAMHVALYVRDTCGLDSDRPPRTAVAIATADGSETASAEWRRWWEDIVRVECDERATSDDLGIGYDGWLSRRRPLGEPPAFEVLADRPELQAMAVRCQSEASEWAEACRRALQRPDQLAWPLLHEVVEQVAAERGVTTGELHARIFVLRVAGPWWQVVRPGVVMCSEETMRDAPEPALWAAFVSSLTN